MEAFEGFGFGVESAVITTTIVQDKDKICLIILDNQDVLVVSQLF
jgi:hypothetical protein